MWVFYSQSVRNFTEIIIYKTSGLGKVQLCLQNNDSAQNSDRGNSLRAGYIEKTSVIVAENAKNTDGVGDE